MIKNPSKKSLADGSVKMKKRERRSKKKTDLLRPICWFVIPTAASILLALDATGIYTFTPDRLTVYGICLAVILLPFFSEITFKNLSVKRRSEDTGENT